MLPPTNDARIYAEAIGKARAFGVCLTSCDVFTVASTSGYVHYLRHPGGMTMSVHDAFDSTRCFLYWKELMEEAENIAVHRKHDQCDYGVLIEYAPDLGIHMRVARYSRGLSTILDSAEAEMSETEVRDLRDWKTCIYLEENGKVPGTPEFWELRAKGEYDYIPYDNEYNGAK